LLAARLPAGLAAARVAGGANDQLAVHRTNARFPLAALASVTIEVVRRGGDPNEVALAAVLLVRLIIAYLAVRTLLLLLPGQLLPQK
jgi:uncharacterized membrane protein